MALELRKLVFDNKYERLVYLKIRFIELLKNDSVSRERKPELECFQVQVQFFGIVAAA